MMTVDCFAVAPYVERHGALVVEDVHFLDTMIQAIKVAQFCASRRPGVQVLAVDRRADGTIAGFEVLRVLGRAPPTFSHPIAEREPERRAPRADPGHYEAGASH